MLQGITGSYWTLPLEKLQKLGMHSMVFQQTVLSSPPLITSCDLKVLRIADGR